MLLLSNLLESVPEPVRMLCIPGALQMVAMVLGIVQSSSTSSKNRSHFLVIVDWFEQNALALHRKTRIPYTYTCARTHLQLVCTFPCTLCVPLSSLLVPAKVEGPSLCVCQRTARHRQQTCSLLHNKVS